MIDKLIYLKRSKKKYESDTWAELIGNGHFAITQTETFNKEMRHTIYLTRAQMEQILKEREVK